MTAAMLFDLDPEEGPVTLEGQVERIRWSSSEGDFQILVLRESPGIRTTVIVRNAGLREGEQIKVTGTMKRHRGELQLHADTLERPLPTTREGLTAYLASGVIPGIREAMAARIVAHFGDGTLQMLDEAPERLREIKGLGKARAEQVRRIWSETQGGRAIMLFLQSHGISAAWARRIQKRYGERAVAVLRDDPYQLARDVRGIGFRSADRIAAAQGFAPDDPRRVRAGVEHILYEAQGQGHTWLADTQLVERAAALLGLDVVRVEDAVEAGVDAHEFISERLDGVRAIYDRLAFEREDALALTLARLASAPGKVPALTPAELSELEQALALALAPGQRTALQRILGPSMAVLTGGPGTGKTTLVRALVTHVQRHGLRLALAAPTGRAARRLEQSTGQSASTLHRLLQFDPQQRAFVHDADNPLDFDVVVVDEASMLDGELALALVEALRPGTTLVLVGDVEQLPSVGAGAVLHDIIASQAVEVCALTEVYRQAAESRIIQQAHAVRTGQLLDANAANGGDFFYLRVTTPESAIQTVERLVLHRIPEAFGMSLPHQVQVLVPMHAGPVGTEALNRHLQAVWNPSGPSIQRGERTLRQGDRVMQTRNNYTLEVYNGDIGLLEHVDTEAGRAVVQFEGRTVIYEGDALDELELAYAISIHKSQGSEFEAVVVLLMTHHYRLLQRNLLYTAMTRARRLLVLVGSPRAVDMAVQDVSAEPRCTGLATRLSRYLHPPAESLTLRLVPPSE